MARYRRLFGAFGAVAVVAGVVASSASALTIGRGSTTPVTVCTSKSLYWEISANTVPRDGVLTSLSHNTGNAPYASYSIKVIRPSAPSIVGSGQYQQVSTPGIHTQATRIQVKAGDKLGLYAWNAYTCGDNFAHAGYRLDLPNNPGLGAISPGSPTTIPGPTVGARFEDDADKDGYGDLTQDACSTARERQVAPCFCVVPKLKATTKAKAKAKLLAAGCTLGKTRKKKVVSFNKKRKKNRVAKQSVKAGTTKPFGTAVTITLYAKKK